MNNEASGERLMIRLGAMVAGLGIATHTALAGTYGDGDLPCNDLQWSGGEISLDAECRLCLNVPASVQLRRSQSLLSNHPSHWDLQRRSALDQAVVALNQIPGVNFAFTVATNTTGGIGYADASRTWNGISEIRFRSDWDPSAANPHGRTLLDGRRVMFDPVMGGWVCEFQSVDVELNYEWDQNSTSFDHLLYYGYLDVPGSAQQPLVWGLPWDPQSYFYLKTPLIPLMAHELGHAMGLLHPGSTNHVGLTSRNEPLKGTLPQGGLGDGIPGASATAGERDWALLLGNHGATYAAERAVLISLFTPAPTSLTGVSERHWDKPETHTVDDNRILPIPPPAYFSAMPTFPALTIAGRIRFEVRCTTCANPVVVMLRQANANGIGTPFTLLGSDMVPTPISPLDLGGSWDVTQQLQDYAVTPGDGLARYQLCVVWTGNSPNTSYAWATTACGHPEMIVP